MPRAAAIALYSASADDAVLVAPVITELFAVASGVAPDRVVEAIPPSCRRPVEPSPPPRREGTDVVLDAGPWAPRAGARHLVPAFAVLGRADYSARFELSVRAGGRWSPWLGTATLGPAEFPALTAPASALSVDIDVFQAPVPAERVRLRLRLRADDPADLLDAPWLLTLSACDLGPAAAPAERPGGARLAVPAMSQMVAGGARAARICSPTSVAMVLAYLGAGDAVERLAAEMFHPALDRYGVWPAAIVAAGRRGVLGYLLRFPDWAAAAWCLDQGRPIIASVRYAAGELSGAAIAETAGHLLVLTGYEDGEVLVNDPAAAEPAAVPRRYRRDELVRVWLERAGVGYVLFRPEAEAVAPTGA
jgi:hypothetical protein